MVRHCIMVAEDDPDEVFLLRWALRQTGLDHQLIDVPDGEAAIEYLRGTPPYSDRDRYPLPTLLVLDLKMPKTNGFDVLAWLGGELQFKELPAVVLSSSAFGADVRRAMELGAREFLTKPSDINDWVKLIYGLHDRWLGGNDDQSIPTARAAAIRGGEVERLQRGPGI